MTDGLGGGVTMTSKYAASLAVFVPADDGSGIREPCGGAVFAVNAGDPDPRMLLVSVNGADPITGERRGRAAVGIDTEDPDVSSDGLATATGGGVLSNLLGHEGVPGTWDYLGSYRHGRTH